MSIRRVSDSRNSLGHHDTAGASESAGSVPPELAMPSKAMALRVQQQTECFVLEFSPHYSP